MTVRIPVACVVVLLLSPSHADADSRPRLAVMPLRPMRGVEPDVATLLTDTMTVNVAKLGRYDVMSVDDIQALIGMEKLKDALGCDDVRCAADIGGAVGADFMLTGRVGKLGGELNLSLTLFDSRAMRAIGRTQKTVPDDESLYKIAITSALRELFDPVVVTTPSPAIADPPVKLSQPPYVSPAEPVRTQTPKICPRGTRWGWGSALMVVGGSGLLIGGIGTVAYYGSRNGANVGNNPVPDASRNAFLVTATGGVIAVAAGYFVNRYARPDDGCTLDAPSR